MERVQTSRGAWKLFIRSSLICGLLAALLFGLSIKKINHLPIDGTPLKFEAAQAHSYMTQLAKGFPNRVTWSESRKKAGEWIKGEFRKLGYSPRGMRFSEVIDGKQYTDLENIYAEKRGTKYPDEIVVVLGHYDIAETTIEGAMDDASGVAVVLELARVFANEQTQRTMIFLATDSEEFGALWGARAFAQDFERSHQIIAAASFDFVAPEKQVGILTLTDGLKVGYTPLWLRELALDSLRSVGGVKALDMTNVVEHLQRAIQIPAADHGALLAAGIPAFNWVGQTSNFPYQMAHYHHTKYDVAEALQVESFEPYGKAAEKLLRTIDGLHRLPADLRGSSYWKISEQFYVEGWVVTLLHLLAFIPFLAYSLGKFGIALRRAERPLLVKVLRNEAKNLGIILGSLLIGYVVILLLPALRIITQYEIFPATQKSLMLYSPNFLAILLVAASIIGVYYLFKNTFSEPDDSIEYIEIRHAFHAAFLALIIFLAFVKNSYLATLLLLPPAYFWTALRKRRRREDRMINILLLLAGSITFIITVIVLNTIFHVGVAYWYLFLSAAYGLFSAYSVVLFFMALAVMLRLFRVVPTFW
ncbi:MAG: M28 family peptidase [Oligoflexia bacterium]|nr:M28 family peptidase [Oligoflexia bacterium]